MHRLLSRRRRLLILPVALVALLAVAAPASTARATATPTWQAWGLTVDFPTSATDAPKIMYTVYVGTDDPAPQVIAESNPVDLWANGSCVTQGAGPLTWQGGYADGSIMIVARVEIGEDGRVRLSAPNAIMDFAALPEPAETDVRTRLLASLAAAWPNVTPRDLDFDGKVFRNPGGVAPQLEWDAATQHMTMFVYPGARPSVQFELERVKEFPS